jgi:hypothetical protein
LHHIFSPIVSVKLLSFVLRKVILNGLGWKHTRDRSFILTVLRDFPRPLTGMITFPSVSSTSSLPEKNIRGFVLVGTAFPDVAGMEESLRIFYDRRAGGAVLPVTVTT